MSEDSTDPATLAARLDAVERALTDGSRQASSRPETAAAAGSPGDASEAATDADLERRVEELDARVTELTAQLDAVRGLLDGVRAVDESVERRADLALATAERLAAERDADGLVAERLPDDGAEAETNADANAAASVDRREDRADGGDGGDPGADSLGARLREVL